MRNSTINRFRNKQHQLILSVTGAVHTTLALLLTGLLFVLITPLLRQPIALHELAALKTNEPVIEPIVISIKKNGVYSLNTAIQPEKTMPFQAIKKLLHKQFQVLDPRNVSLCIKVDPTIPYKEVAKMIDWAEKTGILHVGLLTLEPDES